MQEAQAGLDRRREQIDLHRKQASGKRAQAAAARSSLEPADGNATDTEGVATKLLKEAATCSQQATELEHSTPAAEAAAKAARRSCTIADACVRGCAEVLETAQGGCSAAEDAYEALCQVGAAEQQQTNHNDQVRPRVSTNDVDRTSTIVAPRHRASHLFTRCRSPPSRWSCAAYWLHMTAAFATSSICMRITRQRRWRLCAQRARISMLQRSSCSNSFKRAGRLRTPFRSIAGTRFYGMMRPGVPYAARTRLCIAWRQRSVTRGSFKRWPTVEIISLTPQAQRARASALRAQMTSQRLVMRMHASWSDSTWRRITCCSQRHCPHWTERSQRSLQHTAAPQHV